MLSLTTSEQKRRLFSFKQDVCTQAGLYAGSLDGSKQKDGWMEPEKFPYLIPFVLESKGEARVESKIINNKDCSPTPQVWSV